MLLIKNQFIIILNTQYITPHKFFYLNVIDKLSTLTQTVTLHSQHLRKSNLHQAIRWGEILHLWDKIYPYSSYHFFKPIPRIIITTTIRSRHDLDPSTVSHFNFIYEASIVSIFSPLFFKLIQYYPYYVLLSPCKRQLQMSSYSSFFL